MTQRRSPLKEITNSIRNDFRKDVKSHNDTVRILRKSDEVLDHIHDMGNPPSIWRKVTRTAKREAIYASVIPAKVALTLVAYMVLFWIIGAIVF